MDQFHHYLLHQLPELSADELAEFTAAFTLRQVRKRQLIIQPGQVAAHLTYVVQGAFQAYVTDPAGTSQTIQFANDDWWLTDVNSWNRQVISHHTLTMALRTACREVC
ncbi:MAG: Crp/Fnr family transcriptional regulator [Janthinobacterium lividum]